MIEALASQVEKWASQSRYYTDWVTFSKDLAVLHEALGRIDSGSGGLESLRVQFDQLTRQARSVQAEIGMKGFAEVDRLRAALTDLNRQFDNLADDRRAAYDHTAARIRDTVASLLDLPTTLPTPAYQPTDDAQSYRMLRRSIATTVSRAIALLEVGLVEDPQAVSQEKMMSGALRKRIRDVVSLTRDPDKLFTELPLSIQTKAIERIKKVRNQVAALKRPDTTANRTRSGLVAALSDLPAGPTEISSLLIRMNDAVSRDELLNDLLQLHEAGMLRLVIDLPGIEDD